jgi:hypothetical protein
MSILGALIGAAIDRTDGDSGIKGAIIGVGLQKTASIIAPLVVTFAIGWAVQKIAGTVWTMIDDSHSDNTEPEKPHG